jgi:hypothetical protein
MLYSLTKESGAGTGRLEGLVDTVRAMNIKSLAFIPARGGSKGVPRKNIISLGGKPLLAYTIEAAAKTGFFSRIIVSTDEPEIADVAQEWGAEVPFLRPRELAGDTALISQAFLYTKERLAEGGFVPDICVYLYPTSPFRNRSLMHTLLAKLLAGYANVFACKCIPFGKREFYDCCDGLPGMSIFSHEHMAPNVAMFLQGIFSGHWLSNRLPAWGTYVHELRHPAHCIDIDHDCDLDLAERFLRENAFDFNA